MSVPCNVCGVQVASVNVPFHDTELLVCYACEEEILHKLAPKYNSAVAFSQVKDDAVVKAA